VTTNNHLYGIVKFQGTFQDASDYAGALNKCCGKRAHLASVTTQGENAFIVSLLATTVRTYNGRKVTDFVYIGLNNLANTNQYVWDGTNETVTNSGGYVNWCRTNCWGGAQLPTAGETFCTSMDNIDGEWYSFACGILPYTTLNFLVFEYDC
jgi:hypothetical protein